MKTSEVNKDLTGKRCKCIFTGMMVTGTIEDARVGKYTADVKVRFDEPHNWGGELFHSDWAIGRLCDESGSLKYLEIIDNGYEAIRVVFSQGIKEIDRVFVNDYSTWHVVNLKEWIDNYESSRFTRIDERTAIITSIYNMDHIKEWLPKNTPVAKIEPII